MQKDSSCGNMCLLCSMLDTYLNISHVSITILTIWSEHVFPLLCSLPSCLMASSRSQALFSVCLGNVSTISSPVDKHFHLLSGGLVDSVHMSICILCMTGLSSAVDVYADCLLSQMATVYNTIVQEVILHVCKLAQFASSCKF